jgi:hypothetical protein
MIYLNVEFIFLIMKFNKLNFGFKKELLNLNTQKSIL